MNSATDVFQKVLAILEEDMTKTTISTWFEDASAVELTSDSLVILTPTIFKKDIICSKYLDKIKAALKQIFSTDMNTLVLTPDELSSYEPKNAANKTTASISDSDFEYTFERFIVGSSNRFPHAAAISVAKSPAKAYNPLFIYGGSGLGKTHLLYAIANFVRSNNKASNIVYVKGDDFTNGLVSAIQNNSVAEFRNKYRQADLLLIDDIQFIAGKERTQEEFFHTFNTLYEEKKQIVLTSDRPPKEIYTLEERLKTRFEWGLLADIQPPDYETRVAIIQNKANILDIDIPKPLVEYIGRSVTANVRQLEGTVKMVLACRDLLKMEINLETVQQAIRDMYKDNPDLNPTPARIIDEVSRFFGIEPNLLKSQNRKRESVVPRQVSMYIMREMTDMSLPDIGREFGGRDHSTVIHSINKVEAQLKNDHNMKNLIKDLMSNIKET